MNIVKYENFSVKVEPELLLLKPFRKLYNADRTVGKDKFLDFMSLVYFVYDPRSDFNYILDEEARIQEVCQANGLKYKGFDKTEQECIDIYKKMTTTASLKLLQDTRLSIEKLSEFLAQLDYNERDDKGRLVNNVAQVISAIDKIPQLIKSLMAAEKAVNKEIIEEGRARGGNEAKHIAEDGIDAFL